MNVTIIGTGYVGLVTGACLAETGVKVVCVDKDPAKVEMLRRGEIPIYEPGLERIVVRNIQNGRLSFTVNLEDAVKESIVAFIAVGTPPDEDGSADLCHVQDVAASIGNAVEDYILVITKSTVPIGTAEKVRAIIEKSIKERNRDIEFDVASNPEFLKEGDAVNDFLKPERIVVGADSEKAVGLIGKLYKPFVLNGHPVIYMDIPSAELTKYAANAMLATRISFMNEIAALCEKAGADINMVRRGIGSDSRIGSGFLYAGTGYGGSCFPKDVKAIIRTGDKKGAEMKVLKSVEEVNEAQKEILFNKFTNHYNGAVEGMKVAVWGLAFKPNTDDMREAPSLRLIEMLKQAGVKVMAYDPVAMTEAKRILGESIEFARDSYDALLDADALFIVTEWIEFRNPNFDVISRLMKNRLIFDGRNIYERESLENSGFIYYGIGR